MTIAGQEDDELRRAGLVDLSVSASTAGTWNGVPR